MRQIRHVGPAAAERMTVVAATPVPLRFTLPSGRRIDEAVAEGFEAAGCIGGFLTIEGGQCEPFHYVIPAASPDALHAAWYSRTYAPEGSVAFERAGAIVGRREGVPYLHCHGIWTTPDGRRMGHLLAPETETAEPIAVTGVGFRTATFDALPDGETHFTLFEPVRLGAEASTPASLLARVRPNVDISLAIDGICAAHGIAAARVYGIGSLNEVRFIDGSRVDSYATEVLIRDGRVESRSDRPCTRLAIDVVDLDGAIASGELVRGDNPVCITFELVIEATQLC